MGTSGISPIPTARICATMAATSGGIGSTAATISATRTIAEIMAAAGIATVIMIATPIRRCFPDRMAGGGMMIGAAMDGVVMMASCGATGAASRAGIPRRRSRVAGGTGIAMTIAGVDATMAGRRRCLAGRPNLRRLRNNRAVGATASLTSTADRPAADAGAAVAGVSTAARLRHCSAARRSLRRRRNSRAARDRATARASPDHVAMVGAMAAATIAVETAAGTATATVAMAIADAASRIGATTTR